MSRPITFQVIAPERYNRSNDLWMHGAGSVYVVQEPSGAPVKIGSSWHPTRRFSSLQCGNPRKLPFAFIASTQKLADARQAEEQLRRCFARAVIINEWFEVGSAEVLETLVRLYPTTCSEGFAA